MQVDRSCANLTAKTTPSKVLWLNQERDDDMRTTVHKKRLVFPMNRCTTVEGKDSARNSPYGESHEGGVWDGVNGDHNSLGVPG